MKALRFEVHEHCFIVGPRAHGPRYKFAHSHEGGSDLHRHPDTGPSSFTIDKDEWLRATGLQGGGRKKFTAAPSGEQIQRLDPEEGQDSFEIIVADPVTTGGEGPGLALPARMILGHKLKVRRISPLGAA